MRVNKREEDLVRIRALKQDKECPQSAWIISDTIVSELLGSAILRAELSKAISTSCERFLFIPWRQWPDPGRKIVDAIEKTVERLPRSMRLLRIFVVPDEIAALCMEYRAMKDGTSVFVYGHFIRDDSDMAQIIGKLRAAAEKIEMIYKDERKQVSVNGIARCY